MKSFNNFSVRYRCLRSYSFIPFFAVLILFFTSCTSKPEPYSILEFPGEECVYNYSKSGILRFGESDSLNPMAVLSSIGDLFMFDEGNIFIYNDTSSQNRFSFKSLDGVLYVNDKIYAIEIPDNDNMIPWFENMKERDFSALQFINFSSKMPESYLPYLTKLAEIKPDAGLFFEGDFGDMAGLLKIFKPRYVAGPDLLRNDYDMLSGLTNLEILMISLKDSVINDPLPSMPELKQLLLTEIGKKIVLTNNFLINNKQIERVFIQKQGSFDFSLLKPLENLKELVITEPDAIINLDLINDHKKLEVFSVTGDGLDYNPALIRLPSLRWMTFSSNLTQEEFNSFVETHPDLEIIQLFANDTISSLQALSGLIKLSGLTVTDTVADIASIKTLRNLKYLSLPYDFLDDSVNKVELQKSLPGTRIVPNEGFCLGSGWLLLLIPLVLIIRFFGRQEKQRLQDEIKS
ncbi:MAG: hypothetical protein MUO72_16395 [Bacteroidales bacterium]|nr:hypothetical protein [Bacteroidales bacterium]